MMPGDSKVERSPSARIKIAHFGPVLNNLSELTLEEFFKNHNVLGFDNGDGELACSTVRSIDGKLSAQPLTFNEISPVYHIPNILAIKESGKALLLNDAQIGRYREIYHNFKRCPGGNRTADKYLNHSGKPSSYTYGYLMGHSFACAVSKLFECNKCLDLKKPTVIMVGRPASTGWAAQEQAYAGLLGKYLKEYLPDAAPITILVLSESCAAMAGEIKLEQNKWLNTVIQILDLGSSTFDSTTVTPGGLPQNGEDSFQFGGNQLDGAMKAYADHCYCAEFPPEEGYVIWDDPGRTASLRFKKEQLYGDNGENLKQIGDDFAYNYVYPVQRTGANGKIEKVLRPNHLLMQYPFPIMKDTMHSVLSNDSKLKELRCTTERLKFNATHDTEDHKSWLEACRYVMTQFYEQTKKLYPNGKAPGRLILTGGVSNMPEVQKIAKEVFHVNESTFEVSKHPSLTVSNGLALVLGNELLKKFLLRELEQELLGENGPLPDADSLLKEMVDAACESDLKYYEEVIDDWTPGGGEKTLKSCIDTICDPGNGIFHKYDHFVEKACENWFQNNRIDKTIEAALHKKFHQMFPTFTGSFHWKMDMPDMSDMPGKKLANTFKINPYMFFDDENCPEDPYNTEHPFTRDQREQILKVYIRHKDALAEGGQESVKGHLVTIKGIRSVYAEQLTVADAKPYRDKILKMLMPAIEDFVESLTYYLAMSAHV